jgi:hypothetical protein
MPILKFVHGVGFLLSKPFLTSMSHGGINVKSRLDKI